jgi:hypothetical protein
MVVCCCVDDWLLLLLHAGKGGIIHRNSRTRNNEPTTTTTTTTANERTNVSNERHKLKAITDREHFFPFCIERNERHLVTCHTMGIQAIGSRADTYIHNHRLSGQADRLLGRQAGRQAGSDTCNKTNANKAPNESKAVRIEQQLMCCSRSPCTGEKLPIGNRSVGSGGWCLIW